MAITIGNSSVRDIYLGNSKVNSVFLGDVLVYGNLANDPEDTYNKFVFDTSKATSSIQPVVTLQDYRAGDTTHWNGYTDWGDGTVNKELSHRYTTSGIYTVKTKYMINDSDGNSDTDTDTLFIRCDAINQNMRDLSYLFYECNNLTSINLSNLDKSLYYKAEYAFYRTSYSTDIAQYELDLSGLKLSGSVSHMFGYNNGIGTLNLSGFDMTKAINTSYMFFNEFGDVFTPIDNIILNGCSDDNIIKIVPLLGEKRLTSGEISWGGSIYVDEIKSTYPTPKDGWTYKTK